jgi:hypothetical protein
MSSYHSTLYNLSYSQCLGRGIAQAVSRRLSTMAARFRCQVSLCLICGGQSGTREGFCLSTSVSLANLHSTNICLMALQPLWALVSLQFPDLFIFGIPSQGLYLNTGRHKHIYTPNIHALSGIRPHDHSVRASENSSCLRLAIPPNAPYLSVIRCWNIRPNIGRRTKWTQVSPHPTKLTKLTTGSTVVQHRHWRVLFS